MHIGNPFKVNFDSHRIFGLDIMRFVAIFAVIWGHASSLLPQPFARLHEQVFPVDGVTIFFVLSGYLIGGILLKTLEAHPPGLGVLTNFWIRRWFRTLPAYLFVLLLLYALKLYFDPAFAAHRGLSYFLFLQNFWHYDLPFFEESWSLSVEEWFYLIIPVLMMGCIAIKLCSRRQAVLFVSLLVLLLITAYRYYKFSYSAPGNIEVWDKEFRKLVVTRLDSLMFGVLGAYVAYYHKELWLKARKLLPIGIVLIVLIGIKMVWDPAFQSMFTSVFYFSVYSFATLICLPYLSQLKTGKGWVFRKITCISIISYSLYLLNHSLIKIFIIEDLFGRHFMSHLHASATMVGIINYMLYWILLFVLSVLMFNYIETPAMKLRNRISSEK